MAAIEHGGTGMFVETAFADRNSVTSRFAATGGEPSDRQETFCNRFGIYCAVADFGFYRELCLLVCSVW